MADLDNPEKIKAIIFSYQGSESFNELLTNDYDYYVRYRGLVWVRPKFTREDKPILLPAETELDQLISKS